jgi:pimeloyl-ACP methyl ester carboxylesterase
MTMQNLPQPEVISVQDIPAAVYRAGSGLTVLMLHGWGASAELVWPLASRLVTCGFAPCVVDFPGFGRTPAPVVPWSVSDYAMWTLDLMNALALDKVHLFGHSFGGRITLVLAADHPERFHKVVLANSAGLRPPIPLLVKLRTKLYRSVRHTLEAVGAQALAQDLRSRYNARFGSADYNAATGVMRETFIRVVSEDLRHYAARVQRPTLLFWGDQDTDTPLWMGQMLEKLIPDAALIVHQGAGHYSYLDRLSETAHIIAHFLLNP